MVYVYGLLGASVPIVLNAVILLALARRTTASQG